MVKILDLPYDWEVWADPDSGDPRFKKEGRTGWRHAFEVASISSLREIEGVYRVCKKWLDGADQDWKFAGAELKYKAMDRAVYGLGFSLRMLGRWHDDLKDVSQVSIGVL